MKRQFGFGVIAAIVVLVILAALAAAIVSLGSTHSVTVAQDVMAARAMQTARAGTEWGLTQAFNGASVWGGASCNTGTELAPVSATVDTQAINGFQATVSCWSKTYNEGETTTGFRQVRIYQILSVACPAAPCPQTGAATAGPGYIERSREVVGM